ncbi:TPA: DUF771 domain-containing protein [Streptococcus suis]|nr:DUF771 domain-containing protein [Streptococcus suis]
MITQFELKLDPITIQLPESHVIIPKSDYDHLTKQASQGRYMTLNEVLEMLSVSRPWFLENVLYKPDIRSKIDIDKNNKEGFVKYPQNQGGRYYFLASKTKKYFEEHFAEIFEL